MITGDSYCDIRFFCYSVKDIKLNKLGSIKFDIDEKSFQNKNKKYSLCKTQDIFNLSLTVDSTYLALFNNIFNDPDMRFYLRSICSSVRIGSKLLPINTILEKDSYKLLSEISPYPHFYIEDRIPFVDYYTKDIIEYSYPLYVLNLNLKYRNFNFCNTHIQLHDTSHIFPTPR